MALNIKDAETEKLATEVARMTGETEAVTVRQALRERRDRLQGPPGRERRRPKGGLRHFLETEIWPQIPEEQRGGQPMTKEERATLLGYGPDED
jgi:antitoxin VapB